MATSVPAPSFTGRPDRQRDDDTNGMVLAGLLLMLAGGLLYEEHKAKTLYVCNPACNPGETCGPGNVCLCGGKAPCPAGYTCNNGVCIPPPPTCGTCPPGQVCDEATGHCVTAPPSGTCAQSAKNCPGTGCDCAVLDPNTNCVICYEIKGGDTLISICNNAYGVYTSPNGLVIWESIYNKNKATIDACAIAHGYSSNFWHWIFPGEVICLPVFDGIVPK